MEIKNKNVKKVLIVCERNVYRSKMFELMAKKLLTERKINDIHISSRGLEKSKFQGSIAEHMSKYPILQQEHVIASALGVGKEFLQHVPKQVTEDDVRNSDTIFVQVPEHKKTLLKKFSFTGAKVFTIKEYSVPAEKGLDGNIRPRKIKITGEREEMGSVWKLTDEIRRIARKFVEELEEEI